MKPRHPPNYRTAVLLHPAQVIAAMGFAILLFATAGYGVPIVIPLALALIVELVVIGLLPRLPAVRRSIDAQLAYEERTEAAAARISLAAALRPEHRRELESLALVAEEVRTHAGVSRLSQDWTGATELVDLFGDLALAYRTRMDTFGPALGPALAEQRALVEQRLLVATGDLRAVLLRHLRILRQREAVWASARCELDRLAITLATIADQLRWMGEQCAHASSKGLHAEIDIVLEGARESGLVMRDLPIDPQQALAKRQRIPFDDAASAANPDLRTCPERVDEELAFAVAAGAASRMA